MDRRTELLDGALSYVLEHGLIGLSLRPLAAALGTSDRMLIYHFGSKETLVADIVALANQRLGHALDIAGLLVHSPGDLVRQAWRGLHDAGGTTRLYLELCVLSLDVPLGRDESERDRSVDGDSDGRRRRWLAAHEQLRTPWLAMLRQGLDELGVASSRTESLAVLILDGIDGLLLDRLVTGDVLRTDAAAAVFADLLDAF